MSSLAECECTQCCTEENLFLCYLPAVSSQHLQLSTKPRWTRHSSVLLVWFTITAATNSHGLRRMKILNINTSLERILTLKSDCKIFSECREGETR